MNINLNQNTSYAKSFRHKSIFLHMVLTALCFCIAIVTIFIFLWLYTEYNNLKDNYRASGENLLLQTSKTMDLTLDQSITGMNSLLYCQDVIRGSVANRLMTGADTVSLLSLLSSNCSTLESVDYIGYYVLTADKAYDSNQNISSLEEAPKIPILRHYLEHGDNITRIQKDTITCDILIYEDTIYLFQSYPGLLYDSQSYLMFELNPEYMSQVISQKESDVPMEIYDHSGNHILSNRATQNAPIADEIKSRIFSTTDHFGYIHASTDSDTDSDVFYLKTKQGWIYLYASPTETLLQTLISVFGSRAFLLLGALLFASLFLSLNLSQKVYRPIRTLVDAVSPVQTDPSIDQADNEVDYLNRAYDSMLSYRTRMQKSLPAIQNAVHEKLFQRILEGEELTEQQLQERLETIQSPFRCQDHFALMLSEFHADSPKKDPDLSVEMVRIQTMDFLNELAEEDAALFSYSRGQHIISIFNFPAQTSSDNCEYILEKILYKYQQMEKPKSIRIIIGLGKCYTGILSLRKSYLEAENHLNINRYYFSCATEKTAFLSEEDRKTAYYINEMRTQIQNISHENLETSTANLEMLFTRLSSEQLPFTALRSCLQAFLLICREQFPDTMQILTNNEEVTAERKIASSESSEEILQITQTAWADYVKALKRYYKNTGYQDMVRVKNYIHANYSDANLSLEMAADMIGSSGSSVSRRFKTAYGCNFLNYVTEYRISKAKEMLESTDIAIQEVGLLTGFPSMPTFFRVFKKSVGVSPGQYRMNHQNQTQDLPHQI